LLLTKKKNIKKKALAVLPLAVKKSPGIPSMVQTMAFSGIFAGAG
jgi:hypothetical protein